jgi:restriction endonuclease S subunit
VRLRPRRGVDAYFLAHFLSSSDARDRIDRRAAGSAIRAISTRSLADLPVELPSLSEQERIASVLRVLDAEADAHERVGELTEALSELLREALTRGAAVVRL